MKFAFVVTNLAGGGAEKALLKLSEALFTLGHEVHVVLLEHLIEHEIPHGVAVRSIFGKPEKVSKGWLGRRVLARGLSAAISRDGPYDLVVSTLPFADEVACLARLPRHRCRIANTLSAEVERLAVSDPRKAARRLARYRKLYRARALVAVSHGVAKDLRERLGCRGPIAVIANPFDAAALRAAAAAPASDLPAGPYVIHVGRFAPQKRHDLLLEAWARLDLPHRLVLLTPPDPQLELLIRRRGLEKRVLVAGFRANPYPWIAGAKLLVLCSDHEGLPNVLIEALLCGTPVLSTDCPSGPREILGPALDKYLVPCGDPAALAEGIARVLASPYDPATADLGAYCAQAVAQAYVRLAEGA
ncbi:MAG: glycosyltransferase [Betaproteobacteria bacterium]|nr:glycosyltransferase [Betaproteobacteria bacterium]MBI2961665.1 glycosyltransferase [Betaproteobacteria bacterium]